MKKIDNNEIEFKILRIRRVKPDDYIIVGEYLTAWVKLIKPRKFFPISIDMGLNLTQEQSEKFVKRKVIEWVEKDREKKNREEQRRSKIKSLKNKIIKING